MAEERVVEVGPKDVQASLDRARPGDIVVLRPGRYVEPLRLVDRRGEPGRSITVRGGPGVVLDGGVPLLAFNHRAQLVAKADWLLGRRPPGIQAIATEAFLTIDCCDHVTVEGLAVRAAWPTAVFVDNATDVTLRGLRVREGAFAFFLHGERTRHVVIEGCSWLQDVTRGDLWRRIAWARVHGDDWAEADARGLDGDFVRSYRIGGDLTVRRNRVAHAFNGVHCFNRRPDFPDHLNENVYIHDNSFAYIRDNPIEPEGSAWNWWVYRNRFFNCHKWFSIELRRSDYFYVFGNVGWFDEVPGPPGDDNTGGSVFKLPKKRDQPHGRHYVFNNSWYLRSPLIKDSLFGGLLHANNAILYARPEPRLFGEVETGDEARCLTRRWKELGIRFENDCVAHAEFPAPLVAAGYEIERGLGQDPGFAAPEKGDFRLRDGSPCRDSAQPFDLELPDGASERLSPRDIGAYQDGELMASPVEPPPRRPERADPDAPVA